jgi:hypothetical protein
MKSNNAANRRHPSNNEVSHHPPASLARKYNQINLLILQQLASSLGLLHESLVSSKYSSDTQAAAITIKFQTQNLYHTNKFQYL